MEESGGQARSPLAAVNVIPAGMTKECPRCLYLKPKKPLLVRLSAAFPPLVCICSKRHLQSSKTMWR